MLPYIEHPTLDLGFYRIEAFAASGRKVAEFAGRPAWWRSDVWPDRPTVWGIAFDRAEPDILDKDHGSGTGGARTSPYAARRGIGDRNATFPGGQRRTQ